MRIRDGIAQKLLTMKFHNSRHEAMTEAEFFMELEPDQRVESFEVTLDGKKVEGEILDAEKARKIYETIVARQKDPALLEYYGARLLRVRIFPLQPNSDFEVAVRTIEVLRSQDGLVRVNTLNAVPASFRTPLVRMTVEATIETAEPMQAVFSPTHEVAVARLGKNAMKMTYSRQNVLPAGPFVFYYQTGEAYGASVLTFQEPGEDGAFMLTVAPPAETPADDRLPRDIVFAIDTSGSMSEGDKIGQVRKALAAFVATLTERDRFNIVTFSTEARAWREGLIPATEEARRAAAEAAAGLKARGGTAIEDALRLSLGQTFRPDATKIVVFLTDGTPTIGQRNEEELLKIARGKGVRIFSFGAGFDLNTRLLDRLAIENGGDRQYIHPNEDAAAVLESFARRIDAPTLADPVVDFSWGFTIPDVTDVHPRKLSDLFAGGSLVLTGRFSKPGVHYIRLRGMRGGEEVSFRWKVNFVPDSRNSFVPRLWAIQRIDFLLDEIRRSGDAQELVDEIVRLSKRYGVITPYTASLITEDGPVGAAGVRERLQRSNDANYNGSGEWELARNQQDWRGAQTVERQMEAANGALGRDKNASGYARTLAQQRNVGSRAFYNRDGNWTESGFETQKTRELAFDSEDYWDFLRTNSGAGAVLALGKNVTFRHNDEWIVVR